MHCASPGFAAKKVVEGFDVVMLTSDVSCLARESGGQLTRMREAVGAAGGAGVAAG
jgi:hypothetical protein